MTVSQPAFNASNSIIVRLNIDNKIGMLANVTQTISEMHGVVGAIDLVQPEAGVLVRDISIFTHDPDHSDTQLSKMACGRCTQQRDFDHRWRSRTSSYEK